MMLIIIIILLSILLIISFFVITMYRKALNHIMESYSNVNDFINDTKEVMEDFANHLKAFNSLEVYAGEPIVEDLIKHCRFSLERIEEINSNLEIKSKK